MFAGRGEQSLVLTLTADFRKVRHILFGSGYGAKVNIFKWINYPLALGRKQDLDIILVFFLFPSHLQNTPPPLESKFLTFSLSPNPKLQITPPPLWKIQISNFFPKSKFEVADYPPPPVEKSKFPTFSLSPNSKLQITPPPTVENPNFQLFPPKSKFEVADYPPPHCGKSKFPTFSP